MSDPEKQPKWEVGFTSAAARQKRKLPASVAETLARLIGDMERNGPIRSKNNGLTLVP